MLWKQQQKLHLEKSFRNNKIASKKIIDEKSQITSQDESQTIGQLVERCYEMNDILSDCATTVLSPEYDMVERFRVELYLTIAFYWHVKRAIETAIVYIIQTDDNYIKIQPRLQASRSTKRTSTRLITNACELSVAAMLFFKAAQSFPHAWVCLRASVEPRKDKLSTSYGLRYSQTEDGPEETVHGRQVLLWNSLDTAN